MVLEPAGMSIFRRYLMKNRKLLMVLSLALLSGAAMAADAGKGASGPIRGACKSDVAQLCKGIKPGAGRIAACLKEHKDQVSDTCKSALKEAHGQRKGAKAGGAADETDK
jgi:hypothetical protein